MDALGAWRSMSGKGRLSPRRAAGHALCQHGVSTCEVWRGREVGRERRAAAVENWWFRVVAAEPSSKHTVERSLRRSRSISPLLDPIGPWHRFADGLAEHREPTEEQLLEVLERVARAQF